MAVKNFCLLWGASGSSKTSLLNTFALGFHEATGKRVRLYTAESAQMGPLRPAIAKGILDVWAIDNAEFPFERVHDACQGAWPEDADDPKARPQPLWLSKYVVRCGHCATVAYEGASAPKMTYQACQKCRQPVSQRVVRELNPTNGWEKAQIGAVLYEGGTAFGEMLMDNMASRSARGEKIGEDVAVRFKDGGYEVGSSSRSSYGIGQRQIKNMVQESRSLPAPYVIWTCTKEQGEDEFTRSMVCGPKLPGNKATADAPRWFGPSLSSVYVPTAKEYRLYVKSYVEDWAALDAMKRIVHICNSRIPPSQLNGIPEFYKYDPADKTLLWRVLADIERRQDAAEKEK